MSLILNALYFFLPAYIANLSPALVRKIPLLNKPVWERKLGKNKTWRGITVAVISGVVVFWLQKIAYQQGFTSLAIIDYNDFSLALGFLLGFGAIVGDAIKSYYKRKADIPSGHPWPVFDQLDFVVGGLLFGFIIYVPPAEVAGILFIISPLLHVLTNNIGYWLKIQKNRF